MKNRRGEPGTRRRGDSTRALRTAASPLNRVVPNQHSPITLLTDFGAADYFVGAMKGVILSINPLAQIVDITHEIPPQDVSSAAFTLLATYESFGPGTIFVAVVDPGVGSSRRVILVEASDRFFVGPDNGIFSYIYDREPNYSVLHVRNEECFRHPVSTTFQGRDIFAPVAAALSIGIEPEQLGPPISDPVRLQRLCPTVGKRGNLQGRIVHIDRFGNCITNLSRDDLTEEMIASGARLSVNGKTVKSFRTYFAEAGAKDEVFAIWGSAGYLEIAARNRSAAKILKARRDEVVRVVSKKK